MTSSGQASVGSGFRVLLAEDDDEFRSVLCCVLRKRGHEVVALEHGRALLGHLAECGPYGDRPKPDATVCDVRMPGYTGLAILRAMAAAGLPAPMVLMTAFGAPELHAEARRLGASTVLDKPFEIERFLEVVERACRSVPPSL